jgi:hypothetical protein
VIKLKKNYLKIIICVGIVVVMVLSSLPTLAADISFDETKLYTGPKVVYKIPKGKPSSPPGQDKKPPKDEGPEPNPLVNKWAVIIGISDYRGKGNDLQYCDDDAQDMYDYLIDKEYPEGNIKLLKDRSAKAASIISAIDWLESWENADSEVVFFFSGHGSTYEGYDDGDTEYIDEGIVSTDMYLILDGQLEQKFSTFESQKISFTFDTCFSGGMIDDLAESGRVVVAACAETEYSYEGTSTLQNGVFTYYYMQGLNNVNTVEGAFSYAEPLAHDFVLDNYDEDMNPQIDDQYSDDWSY